MSQWGGVTYDVMLDEWPLPVFLSLIDSLSKRLENESDNSSNNNVMQEGSMVIKNEVDEDNSLAASVKAEFGNNISVVR